jgi:hypothetical protein
MKGIIQMMYGAGTSGWPSRDIVNIRHAFFQGIEGCFCPAG